VYLLDTNILIYARDGQLTVTAKFRQHDGDIYTSALVLAELQLGLHQPGPQSDLRRARLSRIIATIPVLAFDANAAQEYGAILMERGWSRRRDFDRMIAAHARSVGAVLVTNNTTDFSAVPNLKLENWAV
jgi:tRNA(fMet)-specific endonuclease VapC